MDNMELVYLKSLAKQFPTIASASTEIINLEAILNLPKGTEHFLTDIHGEYEQFNHVLKNGSGSVRRKIDEEFGNTLSLRDKKSLATLIYYPVEKLEIIQEEEENLEDFFHRNPGCNFYCFSTKAPRCYTDVVYETPVFLFFGKETRGLPEDFLRENLDRCVRIPMRESLRSLNLSNSAAIGVYEVLRQSGFRGQQEESDYLSES